MSLSQRLSQRLSSGFPFSAMLAALTACGGSSGGGASEPDPDAGSLRAVLAAEGIQPLPAPPHVSDELFALGQALFFDKVLSGNEDISCATCHLPQFALGDGRTLPSGVGGIGLGPSRSGGWIIPRNGPALFTLHLKERLFWDGRVEASAGGVSVPADVVLTDAMRAVFQPGLEVLGTQAMIPPFSRIEMRGFPGENDLADDMGGDYSGVWAALLERLLDLPGYIQLLRAAYPQVELQDFNFAHAANAIAAFETRAFARTDSAFARFVGGDDAALTPAQVEGALEFFGRADCSRCHSGPTFSDQEHHNIGLPQLGPGLSGCQVCTVLNALDIGRAGVTGLAEDRYRFRTPSLLNVALTGPYGHAGQFARLEDFVTHYRDVTLSLSQYDVLANVSDPLLAATLAIDSGGILDTLDATLRTPNDFDVDAVVAFLHALTSRDAITLEDIVPTRVPSGLPIF